VVEVMAEKAVFLGTPITVRMASSTPMLRISAAVAEAVAEAEQQLVHIPISTHMPLLEKEEVENFPSVVKPTWLRPTLKTDLSMFLVARMARVVVAWTSKL
jgi:hypothetical protein